ncbi:MAG: GlsB/YeaQ/YmgE family stress response membrane protein [Alphaproteobacteria bacterium]|nr:GlsB/YeaQ/YmgE family stress response membrane protein [Alphaproteobacteria bacterium]
MTLEMFLIWIAVGAIAGWLAGLVVTGGGLGLIGNIIVGILGSFVAGWLLPRLGVHLGSGIGAHIIDAAIGGVVVLLILSLVRRA